MRCDLCGMEGSPSLMRACAFGRDGASLTFHVWCEDQFLIMPEIEQDRVIRNATHRRDSTFAHKTM
jgi:hypothetical protein